MVRVQIERCQGKWNGAGRDRFCGIKAGRPLPPGEAVCGNATTTKCGFNTTLTHAVFFSHKGGDMVGWIVALLVASAVAYKLGYAFGYVDAEARLSESRTRLP
jgi:hypothetical protein